MRSWFKVGDIVIGNSGADRYGITVHGWKGKVIAVEGDYISVTGYENHDGHDDNEFFVAAKYFDLYKEKETETMPEENPVSTMTRGDLYEIIFGCPHHDCPTESCDDCPLDGDCDHDSWWNAPLDNIPDILESPQGTKVIRPMLSNPEHERTTRTRLEGLAEEYNYSDSAGLAYLTEDKTLTLTPAQRKEVETLVLLNSLIFEYNSELYTEEDYRRRYTALLEDLGITFDSQGYAHTDIEKGETT